MTTTLTIRIDEKTKERLDNLAKATARTKSYIVDSAIKEFLETNEWQIKSIKESVERADREDAKFIDHEKVSKWITSWGTEDEPEPPKCD
ncbi:MAG TPA: ribbon-helix-helix protein, CopG family [Nitrospirae bacterium]|nr:ribbon-helix-helix protein, CopG family [Nitrospirota bacterium]